MISKTLKELLQESMRSVSSTIPKLTKFDNVQRNNSKDMKQAITVSIPAQVGNGTISPRTVRRHHVGKELHCGHLHHGMSDDFSRCFRLQAMAILL